MTDHFTLYLALGNLLLMLATITLVFSIKQQSSHAQKQQQNHTDQLNQLIGQLNAREQQQSNLEKQMVATQQQLEKAHTQHRERFDANQLQGLKLIQDSIHQGMKSNQTQTTSFLESQIKHMHTAIGQLTQTTQSQLDKIHQQVDKRLAEGFEKTTSTFTDVVKRLAIIDAAQQKITELSSNVVSLQDLLSDKRARGAFGEMQLNALVRDLIPEANIRFQHTFSNGKRADCVLLLPEPTGTIAIDAKFPLENYQLAMAEHSNGIERQRALARFKQDIKKHIDDIASKYIIATETADGAIMFIPSEAIFCEIHSHHSDLIHYAQQKHVWLVSPTTMMAVLTTAATVLKDAATRKQVNLIQQHLIALGKDFSRFRQRMQQLAKHIEQAHQDASQVHITSQKIANRFDKIEQVELPQTADPAALLETSN
jgi:DNA recombination protein RmuC